MNLMPRSATCQLGYPLDEQCRHTYFHMAFNPPEGPVVHRRHLDLGPLERAEASFDDHQALVTAGGIFQADGVVVGLDHPFTVIFGRFLLFSGKIMASVNTINDFSDKQGIATKNQRDRFHEPGTDL